LSISIDGTSIVFNGTVTISNATNPTAGVATLTLTPSGGVGNLPALVDGAPGLPPTLSVGTVTTLSVGTNATATLVQTAAGGPGVASAYNLNLGIPVGATGAAGTNSTLAGCSDINASPAAAVGSILNVASLSPTKFSYMAFPWAFVVNPSTITTVSASGQSTQTLCTVSVPAQSFNWVPICLGAAITAGTVNTVLKLQATLTAGLRSGDIIGQFSGYAGQATQTVPLNSGFGALMGPSQVYGVVTAGSTATIALQVIETATTADAWSVTNTNVQFTVLGVPIAA
jgi:hypothetical protein